MWSRPNFCISRLRTGRRLTASIAVAILSTVAAAAQDEPWEGRVLGQVEGLVDLRAGSQDGTVVAETRDGPIGLGIGQDGTLRQVALPERPVPRGDLIPHSRCAEGTAGIQLACLTGPTRRYGHGVLGDAVEAEAVAVRRQGGGWSRYRLQGEAVFEDLEPRLADLDGDGQDEIIVVKATPGAGASLVVLGLDGDRLGLVAEGGAIGQSYRWLNPVGVGDFDGNGRLEVAVVETPHIGGILKIYRLQGARMSMTGRLPGYSNHRMGSTALGLGAVVDIDGDGLDDILLPRQDRSRLAAVSFAGGAFREVAAANLGVPIATSMVLIDIEGDGRPDVVFGLEDDRLVALMR